MVVSYRPMKRWNPVSNKFTHNSEITSQNPVKRRDIFVNYLRRLLDDGIWPLFQYSNDKSLGTPSGVTWGICG